MRTLVLSDVHLGSKHTHVERLNRVLEAESFDRLILNGDTIHHLNFRKWPIEHWRLLERFRQIGRQRQLVLIRGNHDHETDYAPMAEETEQLSSGRLLPSLLGVPMVESFELDVRGEPYHVTHGDIFDPSIHQFPIVVEVAYQCYQFTSKINKKLAKWMKKKSKRMSGLLELVRVRSLSYARRLGKPGIIIGHTHFGEDFRRDGVHYVNTGSWTECPCSYVTLNGDGLQVHHVAE